MAFKGIGRAVAKGVPFVFVWSRAGTTAASVEADDNRAVGLDYTHEVESTDHRDGNSSVFAVSFNEPVHTISIRIIPVGDSTTNTAAQARLHAITPDVGSDVVLSGGPAYFTTGQAIDTVTGSWIYKGGGSVSYSPDGAAEMTMTLYRHGFDVGAPTTFVESGTF